MPLSILLIVLLSSFIHAGWNYLSKTIPGGSLYIWLLALVMSVVLFPVSAWYLWRYGFDWNTPNIIALFVTRILHTVYFMVLQKGYSEGDLSVVYPLARGMGPVFSGFGAFLFLGEKISVQDIFGLLCIGAGAMVIGGFSLRKLLGRDSVAQRDDRLKKGIYYGILTGFLISCYTIYDGYCVKVLAIAPIFVEYTAHPMRLLLLMPHALKNRAEVKAIWLGHWFKILVISIVSPLAFILVLYAMKSAPVHAVAPIREFSIVIGVLLGAKLLAEEQMKVRLMGSGLILLGIVLLALG
jgi:drug/metabolite transporter (DMT)-like permease